MTAPFSSRSLVIGFLRRGYSTSGGVEVYLKGLATGLRAQGCRVILIGTAEWPSKEWPGGEILRCEGKSLTDFCAEVQKIRTSGGIDFDLILSVEKVPGCDLYRTDEGLHLAWLTERENHISPWAKWFQWCSPKHREKLALERQLFRAESTRRVISISHKISRDIVKLYGYPEEQISLIRNGVPQHGIPSEAQRSIARQELGISPDEKVILFVGTGWERKGLKFAIQAVEKLSNDGKKITLLVAGKGRVKNYFSPVVRFLGPVKEMATVYTAADLFITPTIFEPFSLAALEALSAGLPVVTSAAAGISEIMTSGVHGEIIPSPDDVMGFSDALLKWIALMDEPNQASEFRKACFKLASQFTLERNLSETLRVIEELIREKESEVRKSESRRSEF